MTMSRSFQGIWIPKEIWLNKEVSMQAKCLWAELHSLYSHEHKGCYASNEYLAEFMGLKIRRIQDLLKELKDTGLLEQSSFDGRTRILKAIVPPHSYEQDCTSDVQNNAPLWCRKMHGRDAESCVPSYIENKVEIIDKNMSQLSQRLARILFDSILRINPKAKPPNFTAWESDIEKMIRIDKRTEQEIIEIINWTYQDKFWCKNILSGKKLREKFDQLVMSMKSEGMKSPTSSTVDRRTRNIDGTPVDSPADGLF